MRHLPRGWPVLGVFTLVVAIVAALVEQAIGALGQREFDVVEFLQNVFRNGVIAVLLAVVTAAVTRYHEQQELRRSQSAYVLGQFRLVELAVSAWSRLPGDDDVQSPGETLVDTAPWTELVAEIDEVRNGGRDGAAVIKSVIFLQQLHFKLGRYSPEGGRTRRLIYLRRLLDDLAPLEMSPDQELAAAVREFRYRATVLLAWVQHTNTTIVERLLVERSTPLATEDLPATTALFELTGAEQLRDAATLHDPVYLLLAHLHPLIKNHVLKNPPDTALAGQLVGQVARILGALRNELVAAVSCTKALAELVEQAHRIRAAA